MMKLSAINTLIRACVIAAAIYTIATMTYAEESLWGNIDTPKAPKAANAKPANSSAPAAAAGVPKLPDSIDAPLPPVPDAKPPQKTTCQLLQAKLVLSPDVMNTPEMQDQIKRTMQVIPDAYKFLVASPQAMNDLYKAYSAQYMKKYCTR